MSELYNRIESLAKERGYKNISELCAASGASRGSLTDLKKGRKQTLSTPTFEKLSSALGLTINEIINDKKTPAIESDDERSIFLSSLMKKLGQLDLSDLDHFDVQADEILKRRQDVKE